MADGRFGMDDTTTTATASATALDAQTRAAVIDALAEGLRARYIVVEVAERVAVELQQRLVAGAYDTFATPEAFCSAVTAQLVGGAGDKHLRLTYYPDPLPAAAEGAEGDSHWRAREREMAAVHNFGFARVERLAGNVGYLDLRAFFSPALAGELAVAAMRLLAATDVLIV